MAFPETLAVPVGETTGARMLELEPAAEGMVYVVVGIVVVVVVVDDPEVVPDADVIFEGPDMERAVTVALPALATRGPRSLRENGKLDSVGVNMGVPPAVIAEIQAISPLPVKVADTDADADAGAAVAADSTQDVLLDAELEAIGSPPVTEDAVPVVLFDVAVVFGLGTKQREVTLLGRAYARPLLG